MDTKHYAMSDLAWKCNLPAFLKEIMECSTNTPYRITFTITADLLSILAQRATEINDPILNIIMLRLGLYDVHPRDVERVVIQIQDEMRESERHTHCIPENTNKKGE